jgi:hypothetical protein
MNLSRRINVLTFSRAGIRVNVEITANVSEISSVSIVRVDMVSDCKSLIYRPVCQIDASINGSAFNGTDVAPGAEDCMAYYVGT